MAGQKLLNTAKKDRKKPERMAEYARLYDTKK